MTFRVFLVDDHEVVLRGLERVIDRAPDFEVIGTTSDGYTAIERARVLGPDAVVLDVVLDKLDGVETTRKILSNSPETKVLAFSGFADRETVVGMFRAGARGFVCKSSSSSDIVLALRTVCAGKPYVDPSLVDIMFAIVCESPSAAAREDGLSECEKRVLWCISRGMSAKEISAKLGISDKAVYAARDRLKRKLGIDSVAGLIAYASQNHFWDRDPVPFT